MSRCLELAKYGAGNVAPNPMVGAILVYEERMIGEGYHKKFGEPHAEVNCLNSVKEEDKPLIDKSTLYVSLEPCTHYGKTPPCTDLIIKNKIPRVVIGCKDVYKEVEACPDDPPPDRVIRAGVGRGKGIKRLQDAGTEVVTGVLENECRDLNKRFFTFHQKQRPYIVLKWAESLNARIGTPNERVLISNEYSNRLVHKWRNEEQAILVGKQTALKDDPALTNRLWSGESPIRCVIDNNLSLPLWLKIFDRSTPTIIFNFLKDEEEKNLKWVKLKNGDLSSLAFSMHEINIQSVLVEGGRKLLQSFIDGSLWDEIRVIRNEQLTINNGINSPELKNAVIQKQEKYFSDIITYFLPSS